MPLSWTLRHCAQEVFEADRQWRIGMLHMPVPNVVLSLLDRQNLPKHTHTCKFFCCSFQEKNWPYPLCSQRLVFFALAYHQLLPPKILYACSRSKHLRVMCLSLPAYGLIPCTNIWRISVFYGAFFGTGPPKCFSWLWLACEVRSKVKCVLNLRHFGEGIGVTKVAVREGAPGV